MPAALPEERETISNLLAVVGGVRLAGELVSVVGAKGVTSHGKT